MKKKSKIFPLILTYFRLYSKTPEIPLEIKLHRMKIYPTNCCPNTPDLCNYTRSGNTVTVILSQPQTAVLPESKFARKVDKKVA